MTLVRKHVQKILILAFVLFALSFLLGLFELFTMGSGGDAGRIRQQAYAELPSLEEEALALDSFMDAWAVAGDRSRDIQEQILRAFRQAQFLTPQVAGAYRLHEAEIQIVGGELSAFWQKLETLQALPIRVRQIGLGVDNENQASGTITVAWLEQ